MSNLRSAMYSFIKYYLSIGGSIDDVESCVSDIPDKDILTAKGPQCKTLSIAGVNVVARLNPNKSRDNVRRKKTHKVQRPKEEAKQQHVIETKIDVPLEESKSQKNKNTFRYGFKQMKLKTKVDKI